jgi:hypothetical protein
MTNTIKIKRSAVASKVPQTGDLELGELAINTHDGKLFTKKDNGSASIVEIGGAGGNVALNDLTDVTITSASSGQVLKFDGSIWANAADSTFSGSYTDLTNKPSLFSGAYADLTGKPTLVSALDDLSDVTLATPSNGQVLKFNGTAWVNAADSTFSGAYADLTGKPTLATVATSGAYADLSGTPSLATVATSGAYADLTGKPTLVSALDDLSDVAVSSAAKGQLLAHNGTSFVNTRTLEANAAATVPLTIKGAASQSANLLNLTDSSNVTLAAITASSRLRLGTTAIAYSEIGFNSGDSSMRVTSINDNCFSIASPDNGSGVYTLTISRNTTRNTWEFSRGATNALAYNFNTYGAAGGGLGINLSAAPGAELHVNSNAATKKGCIIRGATSQSATLLEVQNSAGTALVTVNAAGQVGIGATPSVQLTVSEATATSASQFKVAATSALSSNCIICDKADNDSTTSNRFMLFRVNNGTGSGQINANGASQAAFGTASDIRLKENVTDLPSQLDAFTRLRPVEFDYKSGAGHQIGFIAQEVEEVYPDLVGTDADGFLMITDMNKNDARLVKVIQELNEKIVALEARITSLESQ